MSGEPLTTKIFVPAHVVPVKAQRAHATRARWHPSRVADRLLVVAMDGEDGGARPGAWFASRVLALHTDDTYRLALPSVPDEPVTGLVAPRSVAGAERRTVAERLGLPVLDHQEFVHRVFFLEAYRNGAATVAFDLPVILASLATRWSRARKPGADAWSLGFCPVRRHKGRAHNQSAHPHCPGVRIEPGPPPVAFIDFTAPYHFGKNNGPHHHRGRWLSLREQGYVLHGPDHSLSSMCRAFEVEPPPVSDALEDRIAALVARLDATCRLAEAVIAELRRHPVLTDENELHQRRPPAPREGLLSLHTPAMLARAYMRAAGIASAPPLAVAPDTGLGAEDVEAAAHSAFRAPRIESLVRRVPQYGVMLDIRSCFPVSAMLQGVSRWWGAERLAVTEVPVEEARAEVEASRPEDYLDPTRWPDLTDLYLVQPENDLLPITIPLRGNGGQAAYESVWGTLSVPKALGPLWFPKALVLISRWRTGKTPTIVRVLRIRPEGRRAGLRPVLFRGETPLDPRRDLIVDLIRARRQMETKGLRSLAGSVKIAANAVCYGIAAQQLRRPDCDAVVRDGVRRYRAHPSTYWAPGAHTCWPLATFTVAGSWLLVELAESLARHAGGEVPLVLTDALLVTSANGTPPEEIARIVIARMERLCPLPDLLSPLVKPQEGTAEAPAAAWCFTVAAPAYARYRKAREYDHARYAFEWHKVSGHGFSQVLDPETGRPHRSGEDAPAWWGAAWQWIIASTRPGRRPVPPSWRTRPVDRALSYRSPGQISELGRLRYPDRSPIRPFATVYQRQERVGLRRVVRSLFTVGERAPEPVPDEQVRPVTYERVVNLHASQPERKMANGYDTGRLRRYVIHASGIGHAGREDPDAHGQEGQGGAAAAVDAPLLYEKTPTKRELRAACRLLARGRRQEIAERLGVSRRRLLDVLTGRATPRGRLAARIIALAAELRQNNESPEVLPKEEAQQQDRLDGAAFESFAALRGRGYSVARIARLAGVTERGAWEWSARRARPSPRHQERMRAALEKHLALYHSTARQVAKEVTA